MKAIFYTLAFIALLSTCTSGQQTQPRESPKLDDYGLSPENAHPNARKLLTEEFYWSPIEETSPFGNDDGSDSFYEFRDWRQENKNESPATFLQQLLDEWGYPNFDLNQSDIGKIDINTRMLTGTDNAIIAVGFGQFVLEGKIDSDIKELTKKAIQRELTPNLVNRYRKDYIETRKELLEKMLLVVDQM